VDLVHRAVDRTWGWFTVNQGRQWPTAYRCAALPEFWFTGLRCKGPRSKRASWGTCFGGHRTAGEGGIGRHRRMVATAFGAHHGVDWSGDRRGVEWLCSRGLYIGWSRGEKVVAVSMAGGCFVITLNVVVSRRGSDRVGIGGESAIVGLTWRRRPEGKQCSF
jgi:hypothetical protein